MKHLLALIAAAVTPATVTPNKPPTESELITKELVAMNAGDEWGLPAAQFTPGTGTPREIPKVKKTEHGFEIQFDNRSPVSTPTVFNGRVYSSGGFNSREYYAFDAKTGAGGFALALSDDGPSASACEQGVCVFNTESCTTFAVDSQTGALKWAWFLGDPQTSAPAIANGRVFTSYPAGATSSSTKARPPTATHVLASFDLQSGKVLWQVWLDADVISAPVAVGNDFLYVSTFNGTVIKLEQATGKIRYATRARATSAPVVEFVDGLESMFVTRRADNVVASSSPPTSSSPPQPAPAAATESIMRTDHNDPETRYETAPRPAEYLDSAVQDRSALKHNASGYDAGNGFSAGAPPSANAKAAQMLVGQSNVATMQQFQGSRLMHMHGARLNVNTMGDEVIGTDPEDGKQLWSHKLSGNVVEAGGALGTAPPAAGNHVIVATLHGDILELDAKTGKTERTWSAGGAVRAQPSIVDGWIYVGTEDGRLVAIDTGDRSLTGWAMWGGNAARTGIAFEKK